MRIMTMYDMMCNKKWYGFIYKVSNGKYLYQNDNDLGFESTYGEFVHDKLTIQRTIKCSKGLIYQIRNRKGCIPDDDGTGGTLKEVVALIHNCHDYSDPMTDKEKSIIKRYFNKLF